MLALAVGSAPTPARGPTLPGPGGAVAPEGSRHSASAGSPGSGGQSQGPGTNEALLGGLPGSSTPRVPSSITRPGGLFSAPARGGLAAPPQERAAAVPLYGTLELSQGAEDEGPADGLTLDPAIDRLVRETLDLKARAFEIPQARGRHPDRRPPAPSPILADRQPSSSPTGRSTGFHPAARPSTTSTSPTRST